MDSPHRDMNQGSPVVGGVWGAERHDALPPQLNR